MSLCDLELRGVKLPERETFLNDLTAEQLVEKINAFHTRLRKESHLQVAPFAEAYFLNLIALYPVSMCSKNMTDSLKLVAALFYFGSQPAEEDDTKTAEEDQKLKELFPRNKPSRVYRGYSLEDLALIFDRTRVCIAEAVKQKQEEAQIILEEAILRCKTEKNALETLTDEERHALVQIKPETEAKERPRTSLKC